MRWGRLKISARKSAQVAYRPCLEPQAALNGIAGGSNPVRGVRLGEDVPDVVSHGVGADEKLVGDLLIALAFGNEKKDFHLPMGQATGIVRSGLRLRPHSLQQLGYYPNSLRSGCPGNESQIRLPGDTTCFRRMVQSANQAIGVDARFVRSDNLTLSHNVVPVQRLALSVQMQ